MTLQLHSQTSSIIITAALHFVVYFKAKIFVSTHPFRPLDNGLSSVGQLGVIVGMLLQNSLDRAKRKTDNHIKLFWTLQNSKANVSLLKK